MSVDQANGSPLRRTLLAAAVEEGCSMKDLTVLAVQNDPFRIDTDAGHRDGAWLATTAQDLGLGNRTIHLRGLHYMLLGRPKPNGDAYANTDADWSWLQGDAGKAARWLGYIPFDQITDQRNTPPEIRVFQEPRPHPYVSVGVQVDIPDAADIEPYVGAYYASQGKTHPGFGSAQPYKLVLFGEKSSLADVLGPIASTYRADLYLPTGEISDTLLYQMAKVGAGDGRPMVVVCFSDADPAGWQMPVSIARKLQAFREGWFADLRFLVLRAALTPDQVREYGLPSTPLKETEWRADRWRAAMGVEQTEIDALASLRPQLLRQIAREVLDPFYDRTLDQRVAEAYRQWQSEAQAVLDGSLDPARLEQIRTGAAQRLSELREQIDAINDALRIDVDDLDLPSIVVPEADMDGRVHPLPLLDSSWSFAEQCRRLIESKAYRNGSSHE
jgi:hypothetical protein